jgi:hypothetical protein
MLSGILDYFSSGTPRSVKAMGYWREANGIQARYQRVKNHWAHHVERTQAVIMEGASKCERRKKAVILGGGMIHDVPFGNLCEMFEEVVLVDIVHPPASKHLTKHLKNLIRFEADITNTVERVFQIADQESLPLPVARPEWFIDDPDVDFVASVNLLSQLPCMPMTYLEDRRAHKDDVIREYARGLIQSHVDYLDRFPCQVALVTDYERIKLTTMHKIVETRDLFFGIKLPVWGNEWEWRLAPCPEADPRHHFYRRVVGIPDWKKAKERGRVGIVLPTS